MITVSCTPLESIAVPAVAGCTSNTGAVPALRIALCCFATPSEVSHAERMQASLAVRFMQQQLASLGAEIALLAPMNGDHAPLIERLGRGDGIDALVVLPTFCPSPSALAAVLDVADRPGLVMALTTAGDDEDEPLDCTDTSPASLVAYTQAATLADGTGMGRKWIGGGLFDVRAWYEAGQWMAALSTSAALAHGQFASRAEALPVAVRDASACYPN